jgi:hypothetical protein
LAHAQLDLVSELKTEIAAVVIVAILLVTASLALTLAKTTTSTETTTMSYTATITQVRLEKTTIYTSAYCCNDSRLNSMISCEVILSLNYPPMLELRYLIETSPSFIAAENGSNYVNDGGGECTAHDSQAQSVMFDFYYETNRTFLTPCNNIQNFTYDLGVTIQLTSSGYNMSSMQIQSTNSSNETFMCTTTAGESTTS